MNIDENLQKSKIIKNNINKHISAQKYPQTTIAASVLYPQWFNLIIFT